MHTLLFCLVCGLLLSFCASIYIPQIRSFYVSKFSRHNKPGEAIANSEELLHLLNLSTKPQKPPGAGDQWTPYPSS